MVKTARLRSIPPSLSPTSSSSQRPGAVLAAGFCIPLRGSHADIFAAVHKFLFCSPSKPLRMVQAHVNTDLPRSLTATGKGTVPPQFPTATSGSSSVPDRSAPKSTVTAPISTYYGDEGNIGAKLAMDNPLALTSREAKLAVLEQESRKQAAERTTAQRSEHQPNPVGAITLIGHTEASHAKAVADPVTASRTSSRKTTFDGIGTIVGIDLAGVSKTQIKKQLPYRWCMQCLACHPYSDTMGSHHIRPLRDNMAMHEAIRRGDLSPVDPWHDVLEAFKVSHPQPPQPPQPQEPRVTLTNFKMTEEEAKMLKQAMTETDDVKERIKCLTELMDRQNEAIDQRNDAANSAQPLGPSTNTATAAWSLHPTGPPPKKRKAQASSDYQQSGSAEGNARSKRRYPANARGSASLSSTLSKMPQTEEAVTATSLVATSEKTTQKSRLTKREVLSIKKNPRSGKPR
jgi:hypothetical protein